jgi:C4-dicarboxylate-specific signal transduction histidine kinase
MEAATLVRHAFSLDKVTIVTDLDERMPIIFGDPEKLKQVWINLLTNARAALAGPGGTILVRSRLFSERQQVTAGSPTPSGISPENQHRIFDPFFTTKPVGQGTGLGLSVSFGIIKDHGGTSMSKGRRRPASGDRTSGHRLRHRHPRRFAAGPRGNHQRGPAPATPGGIACHGRHHRARRRH